MSPKHASEYKGGPVPAAKTPSRFLRGPAFLAASLVLGSVSTGSAGVHAGSSDSTVPSAVGAVPVQGWTQDFFSLMQLLMQFIDTEPPPKPDPRLLPTNWAAQLNAEYAAHGIRPNLSDAERVSAQNAIADASRLISSHPEAFPEDLAERTKATLQSMSIDLYSKP